jgi:hypothetical protein
VSVNPSPGELAKHGHLYSVMITANSWNITEHNDKSDLNSQSRALAQAAETFETGRWYTLVLENNQCRGYAFFEQLRGLPPWRVTQK